MHEPPGHEDERSRGYLQSPARFAEQVEALSQKCGKAASAIGTGHTYFLTESTVQPLALLVCAFYPIGMLSSKTIGTRLGPIFYMIATARCATLRASVASLYPTLAIDFFAATPTSPEPGR
jgi:hypothetical protein